MTKKWPEECPPCTCGHGECVGCLTRQTVEDFNKILAQGKTVVSCGMHTKFCDVCFVCNLIDRLSRRAKGEIVPPPT